LLCGCFLANAAYCGFLFTKNRTGRLFLHAGWWEWCGSIGMGAAWIIGVLAYGAGAKAMGPLGPVLGFPVFTALMLVCAYGAGRLSGEWRGVDRTTVRWMNTAVMLNVISVFVIGYGR
jgi:L-rhamnose-H+ transport protein